MAKRCMYFTDEDWEKLLGKPIQRIGKRRYPCPSCKRKNQLTAEEVKRGYVCNRCADGREGNFRNEY